MSVTAELYVPDPDSGGLNETCRLAARLVMDAADACGIRLRVISLIGGLSADSPVAVTLSNTGGTGYDRTDTKSLALAIIRRLPGHPTVTLTPGTLGIPDSICIRVNQKSSTAVMRIIIRTDPATSATLVLAIEAAR